ncbi:MAG: response regulator [Chloroflexota bacterium]
MTKTILLVDDEEAILELISATLTYGDGYQFVLARDGEEALNTARRDKPDLILLDILMPKRDGYYVCQALKQDPETAHIKVLILTALAQEMERQKALDAGADGYLTKPFSPMMLLEKLEESLSEV